VRKSHHNIAVPPIVGKEVPILAYHQDSLELDARWRNKLKGGRSNFRNPGLNRVELGKEWRNKVVQKKPIKNYSLRILLIKHVKNAIPRLRLNLKDAKISKYFVIKRQDVARTFLICWNSVTMSLRETSQDYDNY
jgi:hypothetical protein